MKYKLLAIVVVAGCIISGSVSAQINPIHNLFQRAKVKTLDVDAQVNMFSRDKTFQHARYIYSDQKFILAGNTPAILLGMMYYEMPQNTPGTYSCLEAGSVWALAPVSNARNKSADMKKAGFEKVDSLRDFILYDTTESNMYGIFSKTLKKGEKLTLPAEVILAGFDPVRKEQTGELLYNGIRLPKQWPPVIDWKSQEPMPVPYLTNRPDLVNIDVGRQLFVDSFLIEETDLKPEYHYPQKYEGNPVLKAETETEKRGRGGLAGATPKSGGLWWNEEKQLFELWYEAGWLNTIAYATSKDGIHWDRPNVSTIRPGTNQVIPSDLKVDSWTVIRDYKSVDPKEAFKMFLRSGSARSRLRYFVSKDGLDWGKYKDGGLAGDRCTMFYNPFRMKWVYSLRWIGPGFRNRAYWEADDFANGMQWLPDEPYPWAGADKLDLPAPEVGDKPQLYNLDAVAYESIMLGFYQILHGPDNNVAAAKGHPKYTGLNFAYSRDGFHWSRPDRTMAINSEKKYGKWDMGYVQSLGNICTVRGDKLWFYYIGYAGDESKKLGEGTIKTNEISGSYANGATGIAWLRRDGFVSLNQDGKKEGTLLTRPLTFSGKYLFVNADAPQGSVAAEIVDMYGNVVPGYSFADCVPMKGDSTLAQISWKKGGDLSKFNNKAMRIRFKVKDAKFYAFWVSRDDSGRSDGYVAGGGPGYNTNIDNAGKAALEAEKKINVQLK